MRLRVRDANLTDTLDSDSFTKIVDESSNTIDASKPLEINSDLPKVTKNELPKVVHSNVEKTGLPKVIHPKSEAISLRPPEPSNISLTTIKKPKKKQQQSEHSKAYLLNKEESTTDDTFEMLALAGGTLLGLGLLLATKH